MQEHTMFRLGSSLFLAFLCFAATAAMAQSSGNTFVPSATHLITLKASTLPSGQLAYEMVSHKVRSPDGQERDVTSRYAQGPTIPGPTLVMKEGENAEVTLEHNIADSTQPVSVHVHGVHYKIDSDGTMKILNGLRDEAAYPGKPYTYKWTAAPGTAGTWMYHDHAFGNPMLGAEDKGLYGTLIVNPASGKIPALIDGKIIDVDVGDVKREFILWMHETTFWGQELNHIIKGDKEIPLWTNPTVGARLGELVRFHVIGIGTAIHTFHLHAHRWIEPGTTSVTDTVNIGPISREAFVVKAGEGVGPGDWHYHCHVIQHMQSGMMGDFRVIE
jgi:FtsP/CotA-like multicopper oxidase with cupredoxin domain